MGRVDREVGVVAEDGLHVLLVELSVYLRSRAL